MALDVHETESGIHWYSLAFTHATLLRMSKEMAKELV